MSLHFVAHFNYFFIFATDIKMISYQYIQKQKKTKIWKVKNSQKSYPVRTMVF